MALNNSPLIRHKLSQFLSSGFLYPSFQTLNNLQIVRQRTTKHWNPKFKKLRTLKVIKVDLPNFHEKQEDLSEDQIRSRMKERGLLPPRPWMEKPFFISSTGGIFEPYVPPEGDGKVSLISKAGAKQKFELIEKKSKSMMAIRKIRSFEEDFEPPEFCEEAQDIYIKSHEFMITKNKSELRQIVTERAYPLIINNIHDKTVHWKFLKSIEPPRVVHSRCTDVITKDNIFGQVTVRFHTQQVLAIYDRFGRLMYGSEIVAKDVLEYVVFEKHLSNEYGVWRLHDKIIPDWMPPREPSALTYLKKSEPVKTTSTEVTTTEENAVEKKTEDVSPA